MFITRLATMTDILIINTLFNAKLISPFITLYAYVTEHGLLLLL